MSWVDNIGGLGPTPQHHLGGKRATGRLIGLTDIQDGHKVLVPGCGNGDTAIKIAAEYDCEVTGTDINPAAVKEAEKNLERNRRDLKGKVVFKTDDLLASGLGENTFNRVIVESVLIMLPKDDALRSIHTLLAPGGILAINEGLRMSGQGSLLREMEDEFRKIGIDWSLPAYEEWREYFESNHFELLSDTSPISYNITYMGIESFLGSPANNTIRFIRMLSNHEARGFFFRVMILMAKARVKWGYCLWVCRKSL